MSCLFPAVAIAFVESLRFVYYIFCYSLHFVCLGVGLVLVYTATAG